MKNSLLLILYLILFIYEFNGQDTFTSIGNGDWDDATASTPWSSSGLDADGIPDNDDIVIIDPGHTIDLPSTKTYVKDLTINGTLDMPNSSCQLYLQANSGPSTLTLNGNIDGIGEIVTVSKNSVLTGIGSISSQTKLWVANNKFFS